MLYNEIYTYECTYLTPKTDGLGLVTLTDGSCLGTYIFFDIVSFYPPFYYPLSLERP